MKLISTFILLVLLFLTGCDKGELKKAKLSIITPTGVVSEDITVSYYNSIQAYYSGNYGRLVVDGKCIVHSIPSGWAYRVK